MSHKNELSLDFKMRPGTTVCAARSGVVTSTKEDSDGTYAAYWHLQKDGVLVNDGDTVIQGQAIGYSGNTGYSAFPHLHFEVYTTSMSYSTIPTRFITRKGIRYLRPGNFYKSVHKDQ